MIEMIEEELAHMKPWAKPWAAPLVIFGMCLMLLGSVVLSLLTDFEERKEIQS